MALNLKTAPACITEDGCDRCKKQQSVRARFNRYAEKLGLESTPADADAWKDWFTTNKRSLPRTLGRLKN